MEDSAYREVFSYRPQNFPDVVERDITYRLHQIESLLSKQNLDDEKKQIIRNEWLVAKALLSYPPNDHQKKVDIPVIDDIHKLRKLGLDPARIVRFLILESAFPKGNSPETERLMFELESDQLRMLERIISRIPGYQSFDRQQLDNLLQRMGFKREGTSERYVRNFNQQELRQLIRQIIFTHSA